jgi:hypothetical protein
MFDKKTWDEAFNLAKSQVRHGNIDYSDLKNVTEELYKQIIEIKNGPEFIDVTPVLQTAPQQALPVSHQVKFKHEIVGGEVKCAICGKMFKTLGILHLRMHDFKSVEEYMELVGVKKEDMVGNKVKKNKEDYPVVLFTEISKAYGKNRKEVMPFLKSHGFNDLKDLMTKADTAGKKPLDFFGETIKKQEKASNKKSEQTEAE